MEWTPIAVFYAICLGFGTFFAIIGAIFGSIFGHFHIGVGDHGIGGGEVGHDIHPGGHDLQTGAESDNLGVSFLNSITISTFIAFFGLAGLTAVWGLKFAVLVSILFAVPVAVLFAAGQFTLFVKVLVAAQGSSEATTADILGRQATVITPIPAGHLGVVSYVIKGSRFTAPAASASDEEIPKGTKVHVVNIRGNTLVVRIIGPIADDE